jgi:SanA protein
MIKKYLKILLFGAVLLLVFVFLVNVLIFTTTKAYIFDDLNDLPDTEVVLVLGASVSVDGLLSPIFTDRLDMGVSLYKAQKVKKILVSGDNSTKNYNEVNPAELYLIEKGVAETDIYLDHAGFDTYSSMYRARDVFKVTQVIVSTQSFHLPRAIFISRMLGLDAYGINADVGHMLFKNTLREVFANQKAVYELLFHIKPKYLGEEIPIVK